MEEQRKLIRGSVAAVIYQNEENGYAVLRLHCEDGEDITVVGTIPQTCAGERLLITGKWRYHASYGRQFEAEFLERLMPENASDILAYFASRALKGVGPRTGKRIVEAFGAQSLDVIEKEPERLTEIPGISLRKAMEINENFCKQVGVRRLIEFLSLHHLPPELAMRLYRCYGELALDAVRDDPYLLTGPYFGVDFGTADAFALELGVDGADERRVEAGILFELSHNLGNGHTFLPRDKLLGAARQLLGLDTAVTGAGLTRLSEQGRICLDTLRQMEVCYLPEFYEAERAVAERILQMAAAPAEGDCSELVAEVEAGKALTYAAQQREAIRIAGERRVMLLTGGPGTGKTTTLDAILDLFDRLGLKSQLAAPTGRAAKRLTELTGREASTIHRLLEAQFDSETGSMVFFHDEEEPLKLDAMIVDEASMVDLLLMRSLLCALPERCRLVLVGDPDQLPSVGAGNLFSDLIRSKRVPTVRLTEIFRQARRSMIVMNAHAVNQGLTPELRATNGDFFFLKRKTARSVVETVQDLCVRRLPERMGIPPEEIQVLCPNRRHEVGTANLNQQLQAVLNPPAAGKRERPRGGHILREGDRVMQIRNNYDILWTGSDGAGAGSGVFNGDLGVIQEIDFSAETVTVLFDGGRVAEYAFDQLSELEHSYAMTVHKSQGSEYRAVILTAWPGSPYLLTRGVLYTAITRARQLFIAVGDESVIAAMAANDRQQRRYSGLKLRLERGGL